MEKFFSRKINIGVSACQFGCKVRYNGKGWDMIGSLQREKAEFIWHPVCPEVMSGMGVNRSPISLKGGNGNDFWKKEANLKNREGKNLNEMIKQGCLTCLDTIKRAEVDVFIYMEGSPSCGVYRTTLRGERLGKPPGIFGSLLLNENIFLIPAIDLQSKIKWWDWRRRMYAYIWLKEQEFKKANEIYDVWHIVKFLCQELFREQSDEIGKKLANLKELSEKDLEEIKKEILNMLRAPSDIKKIKQSLWKNYSFLRKKFNLDIGEIMEPSDIRNMTHIAEELIKMEIITTKNNFLFGSSPIYRKR